RRFRAGHILRHISRRQIQARRRQIGIELDRGLEVIGGSGVLARRESVDALIQVVAGLQFVTSGTQCGQRDQSARGNQSADLLLGDAGHYLPSSTFGVMRPTLSIPEPCAISIACATFWNSRSLSP